MKTTTLNKKFHAYKLKTKASGTIIGAGRMGLSKYPDLTIKKAVYD